VGVESFAQMLAMLHNAVLGDIRRPRARLLANFHIRHLSQVGPQPLGGRQSANDARGVTATDALVPVARRRCHRRGLLSRNLGLQAGDERLRYDGTE